MTYPPGRVPVADTSTSDFLTLDTVPISIVASVVPVITRSPDGVRGWGTAFSIARYASGDALFVTADHVVAAMELERPGVEGFVMLPKSTVTPAATLHRLGARVTTICRPPSHSDVALLVADVNTTAEPLDGPAVWVGLSLGRPRARDRCLALGYSETKVGEFGESTAAVEVPLHASESFVERVHHMRRDTAMLNFPCFRTSAYYAFGMSGGPIISAANGCAIGVVSTASDGVRTAYGALTGSLLELSVQLRADDGTPRVLRFDELIAMRAIPGLADHDVSLRRRPEGVRLSWPRRPSG